MTSSTMHINPDLLSDDPSSVMGAETLLAHDLVPEGLPASSKEPAEQQQKRHIGGVRYLAVDQTANRRQGSKVSKIWLYGAELRALDRPNLDKYWLLRMRASLYSAKKLITPERNSLGDNIIEALECLRAWWNNGLIKRPWSEGKMYATSVFCSQIYPSLPPGRQFPNLASVYPLQASGRPACWEH